MNMTNERIQTKSKHTSPPGLLALVLMTMFIAAFPRPADAACSNPTGIKADIVYNSSQKLFEYCNDTNWVRMNPRAGSGTGGCTNPAMDEGKMVYNADHRVMQGCAGNVWRALGAFNTVFSGSQAWQVLASRWDYSCGIKQDGSLWCWGGNGNGQIGNNSTVIQNTPLHIQTSQTWKHVAVGRWHTCAIRSDNTLWCWGGNGAGRTGLNTSTGNTLNPTQVSGGGSWKTLSLGHDHSCGIKADNTAWCWGSDSGGQIGNGVTAGNQPDPVAVNGGGTWLSISTGTSNTCGTKSDNTGWCWGSDLYGELGNGAAGTADAPTSIVGGTLWKTISTAVNGSHTCGISISDQALCWGYNSSGQLGTGTPAYSLAPVNTACGAPYGKPGAIRYNSTEDRMQYCDSVNWVAFGGFGMGATIPPPDPCAGSPAAGTVCGDGTVYAGLSPDGNVKMFVTRCDVGQTWDGSSCINSRQGQRWGDEQGNPTDTSLVNCTTAGLCASSGAFNTTTLASEDADSVAPGIQLHNAAQYCNDLSTNGHSDWYLPSIGELNILYTNRVAIGEFNTSGNYYWSSSEYDASSGWKQRFTTGVQVDDLKGSSTWIRCARK